METHIISEGCEYITGDAVAVMDRLHNEVSAVFFDDAWASPQRITRFSVEYDTHAFDETQIQTVDPIDFSVTTTEIIDASRAALIDGGWLIADAEDWFLPHLVQYLKNEWGDVAQTDDCEHGGYRKVGGVTYLSPGNTPSRDTDGAYLSAGGYSVVFAHKGQPRNQSSVSARQLAKQRGGTAKQYGWESVKPIEPYEAWIDALVEPGERILIPCAGTAPAAIAAERVFGDAARYTCIDAAADAYKAFKCRRDAEVSNTRHRRHEK